MATYGAEVSEITVRRYVASRKQERARQAFVPLEFPLGSMAEVDFGRALFGIGDVEEVCLFFALRLMASGVSFVKVFPHEKLESMLDGIASGLAFLGGVPRQLMFDNTSVIVREILGGGLRIQTPEFKALAAHYGFEAVFTNPGAPTRRAAWRTWSSGPSGTCSARCRGRPHWRNSTRNFWPNAWPTARRAGGRGATGW